MCPVDKASWVDEFDSIESARARIALISTGILSAM